MKPAGPSFAFQLKANEHLFHDGGEVLGSKKTDITLTDGSTKSVTLFFRVPEDQLHKLQASQQADSTKATKSSVKELPIARGLKAENVESAMKKINSSLSQTQKEARMLRQKSEKQIRQNGVKHPQLDDQHRRSYGKLKENLQTAKQKLQKGAAADQPGIPASLFRKTFDNAIKDGQMVLVDPALKQQVPQKPIKTAKPLPTPPAKKIAKPLPPTPQRPQTAPPSHSALAPSPLVMPPLPDLPDT